MYTDAGDKAIDLVLSQFTSRATPIKKSEVQDIVQQISAQVEQMGIGKVNPAKYGTKPWEGFSEVSDTAVRETLYCKLMKEAVDD